MNKASPDHNRFVILDEAKQHLSVFLNGFYLYFRRRQFDEYTDLLYLSKKAIVFFSDAYKKNRILWNNLFGETKAENSLDRIKVQFRCSRWDTMLLAPSLETSFFLFFLFLTQASFSPKIFYGVVSIFQADLMVIENQST